MDNSTDPNNSDGPTASTVTIHHTDPNGPAAQIYIDALNAYLETLPSFANLKGPKMGGPDSPRPHHLPAGSVLLYATERPPSEGSPPKADHNLGALCLMPLYSTSPQFRNLPPPPPTSPSQHKTDSEEPLTRAAEIKRMFVFPAARGKGVATALVREAERYAREAMGVRYLVVETLWLLEGAQRLYRQAGFEERGVWGGYVESDSVCFGKWV